MILMFLGDAAARSKASAAKETSKAGPVPMDVGDDASSKPATVEAVPTAPAEKPAEPPVAEEAAPVSDPQAIAVPEAQVDDSSAKFALDSEPTVDMEQGEDDADTTQPGSLDLLFSEALPQGTVPSKERIEQAKRKSVSVLPSLRKLNVVLAELPRTRPFGRTSSTRSRCAPLSC